MQRGLYHVNLSRKARRTQTWFPPTSIMHIVYMPRERPPFSALNFRAGAYHFHKWPKYSAPEHHHLIFFCRSGDHHFRNLFTFKSFIAAHGWITAASPNAKRSGSAPGLASYITVSSGDAHFHARARSGTPHFSLCRGTYLPKFWGEYPPPPPGVIPLPCDLTRRISVGRGCVQCPLTPISPVAYKSKWNRRRFSMLNFMQNEVCDSILTRWNSLQFGL